MPRLSVLAAVATIIAGAAFVAGSSTVPPVKEPERIKSVIVNKTLYFNMAAVMQGFERAKTEIAQMNRNRERYQRESQGMLHMHSDLRRMADQAKDVPGNEARTREIEAEWRSFAMYRQDLEQRRNQASTDKANQLISSYYETIYDAVREIAKEQGAVAILAYPDGVTEADRNNPYLNELKLKPPAAQPFYLDPSVDCTAEVIKRINVK